MDKEKTVNWSIEPVGYCTDARCASVTMATNRGLEPWEVEKGLVLACQSRPLSDTIVLDYDKI